MEETIARRKQRRHRRRRSSFLPVIGGLLLLALIVVGVIFIAASLGNDKLELTLLGDSVVTLEFGDNYTEPGVKAHLGKKDLSPAVSAAGQVNPDKLGTYTITYTVTHNGETVTAQRTVRVVDTTAPTIVLIHNENSLTLPGHEYEEEGFVAEDNYDGNITDKVQRTVEDGAVIYRVTDSSGNTAEVRRTIQYGDNTPPELVLLGGDTITIIAGTPYKEPGFTATDNLDGDITAKVHMSGAFDIHTPGSYTIVYSVTDSHGNTTTAVRTLVVEKAPVIDPTNKVIYLTFDDGPSQHTLRLLDILAKYNVKATFFVVGSAGMQYVDDIAAGGHAIALHSNTHDYSKVYASEEAFYNDITTLRQRIKDLCGVDTTLIRFPGGSSNTISRRYCKGIMTTLTQSVVANGYQYFDWNVDSMDAGGATTAEEVYQNVIRGVQQHPASVVLQHDIYGYSVDAVESIIQWGLANGYTFLPLSPTSPGAHHDVSN